MSRRTSSGAALVGALVLALAGGIAPGQARAADGWVGSWAAAPTDANAIQPLVNQTLRMVINPHLSGTAARVRLSNRFGTGPVTLGPVSLAQRADGAAIVPGTSRPVLFGGRPTVTIPAGADVSSDATDFAVQAFRDVSVDVVVPGTIPEPSEHASTRQLNYLSAAGSGDRSADVSGAGFGTARTTIAVGGWYFLSGLDVLAPQGTGAVATLGDSITDGVQMTATGAEDTSAVGQNARYPDALARRLFAAGIPLSTLNAGISGNRINSDGLLPFFGVKASARIDADALDLPGVTSVVILEGINDIGMPPEATAQQVIDGLSGLIAQARAAHKTVLLGTLTPTGGYRAAPPATAATREAVNEWIRTRAPVDRVVDFDAAVRDPEDPSRLAAFADGGDHLHMSPAGYAAMAAAVPFDALTVPPSDPPPTSPPAATPTTATPTSTTPAPSTPTTPVASSAMPVARATLGPITRHTGRLRITVTCRAGGARCSGPLKITAVVARRPLNGRPRPSRLVALARTTASVGAGQSRTYRLRPTAAGRRLLRRPPTVRVRATLRLRGVANTSSGVVTRSVARLR